MEKEKVLIIKTGYSEILHNAQDSKKTSFGDILRTTPILYAFKDDNVTWVTDKSAFPLLENNPFINRLLNLNFETVIKLLDEEFDTVINLEKNHDICKLSNKINAWRKYGFRYDNKKNSAEAYDRASEILTVSFDSEIKKSNQKTIQELLFEMIGKKWSGEEYILGYCPRSSEIYDIALNPIIGSKWPTKSWQTENWNQLYNMLTENGFKVTRQDEQGPGVLEDLYGYIDWINSSKLIITPDTLGLHLAIALKKKVLGLFGPTPHKEFHFYDRGKAILPEPTSDCLPCFQAECKKERHCMLDITPKRIYEEVKELISK